MYVGMGTAVPRLLGPPPSTNQRPRRHVSTNGSWIWDWSGGAIKGLRNVLGLLLRWLGT